MEKITRGQLRGVSKKGKPGKKRSVCELTQHEKDQLLLYVRERAPGSWEAVANFWNSLRNLEEVDAEYLRQKFMKLSQSPRKSRPARWTPTEKVLLLRTVYDTIILQYEKAKKDESSSRRSELQGYQIEDPTRRSDYEAYEKSFAEELQRQRRRETIKICEKVLQPYLNEKSGTGGPNDIFVTVNEGGIEAMEKPWTCLPAQIPEQELRARLKIAPMNALDWDSIEKVWNEREDRKKRTRGSLQNMFSRLQRGQS